MGDPGDPDDHAHCVGWCEMTLSPAQFDCVSPLAHTCDWDAFEPCFEMLDPWCDAFCSKVSDCGSGNRSVVQEACVEECNWGTLGRDPSNRACMDAAADSCDMDGLAGCFPEEEACVRMCSHVFLECGLPLGHPSGEELGWPDCMYLCKNDFWSQDELHCLTTASCDAGAMQACQPGTCEGLCSDLADCSTANPDQVEQSCLDSCLYAWTWGDGGSFSCLVEAASTCDADALAACFPDESPECATMCNHLYFECGVSIREPEFRQLLDRDDCALFCEYVATQDQIECLQAAECSNASVNACLSGG